MKKLPIGIQNIGKILKNNKYLYVDKTGFINKLIEEGSPHYFCSRPRRFGKSLFLDTLKRIFEGDKDLFKGCAIYENKKYEWKKYPVVLFDFYQVENTSPKEFKSSLLRTMKDIAKEFGLSIETPSIEEGLKHLIISLSKKKQEKVVVLVDEYDRPIIDHLNNTEIAKGNRYILKSLFGTLKILDVNLHVCYGCVYIYIDKGVFMTTPSQSSKICKFIKPRRTKTNKQLRDREYLTEQEVDLLIKAIRKQSRNPLRDETIVTMMFRHGLRVSEVINLKWEQIDFKEGLLHVARIKNGKDSVHPIPGVELRLLRRLERQPNRQRHLFLSERKSPITNTVINRMVQNAGKTAGIEFPVHPHMLRHACGFYLANKGTDLRTIQMYLGHANIANTVIYTQLSSSKFNGLWND